MVASSTMVFSPSVHSSTTSPGSPSTVKVSTCTSPSVPRARVITLRCGWRSASASDSSPARTSSPTSEWSSDSWRSSPARSR